MKMVYYYKSDGFKNNQKGDFPGGPVVENLPANAGDMGSVPDPVRSHEQWSNSARGPQLLSLPPEPALCNEKPRQWQAHAASPQLGKSLHAEMKTQRSQKE